MFKRITQMLAVLSFTAALTVYANTGSENEPVRVPEPIGVMTRTTVEMPERTSGPAKVIEFKTLVKASSMMVEEPDYGLTDEEIELIALVTMAEAEGECEEGKRLVIDTILNRVDSELRYFPDTVYDVIYQEDAFSSMWNGRVDRVEATDEVIELVKEELLSRTNSEVLYFHAKKYGKFGTPLFSVGNHYFSGK